jgi:pimeloyl-ACP methyl ester carboxylesterase
VAVAGLNVLHGGSGPPLVLLHGTALDSSRLTYGGLMSELAKFREVWALDWPGHGESPPSNEPMTIEGLAARLAEFVDAAGLQRFDAAAFSMGGAVLLRFMLDRPTAVERAALFSSYGLGRAVHVPALPWAIMRAPGGPAAVWGLLKGSAAFREAVLRLLVVGGRVEPSIRADVAAQMSYPHVREAFLGWLGGELGAWSLRTDLRARLGEISAPVRFVHGTRDRIIPPHRSRRAAGLVPVGSFRPIPGAGHWALRERPEECLSALRDHFGLGRV